MSIASISHLQLLYAGYPFVRSYYAERCSARNCGVDGRSGAGMRRSREVFLKVRLGAIREFCERVEADSVPMDK
jgi:hypothetical protein